MREATVMTGGRYLILTDESVVSCDHAEPPNSCYGVTLPGDLVVRILKSERGGRRIGANQTLREVRRYVGGVCRG